VLTQGPTAARKALFEALVEEVVVEADNRLIPAFRIPTVNDPGGKADQEQAAIEPDPDESAVRALPCLVDRTWQNVNRVFAAQGPIVMVKTVRTRPTVPIRVPSSASRGDQGCP
jgi:hypothetical protein